MKMMLASYLGENWCSNTMHGIYFICAGSDVVAWESITWIRNLTKTKFEFRGLKRLNYPFGTDQKHCNVRAKTWEPFPILNHIVDMNDLYFKSAISRLATEILHGSFSDHSLSLFHSFVMQIPLWTTSKKFKWLLLQLGTNFCSCIGGVTHRWGVGDGQPVKTNTGHWKNVPKKAKIYI